jgi:hypothetical protein
LAAGFAVAVFVAGAGALAGAATLAGASGVALTLLRGAGAGGVASPESWSSAPRSTVTAGGLTSPMMTWAVAGAAEPMVSARLAVSAAIPVSEAPENRMKAPVPLPNARFASAGRFCPARGPGGYFMPPESLRVQAYTIARSAAKPLSYGRAALFAAHRRAPTRSAGRQTLPKERFIAEFRGKRP